MPIPQLKVRAISPGSIAPPGWSIAKIAGKSQRRVSTIAWQVIGQNPWNILEYSAAGDVGQALDPALLHQGSSERT